MFHGWLWHTLVRAVGWDSEPRSHIKQYSPGWHRLVLWLHSSFPSASCQVKDGYCSIQMPPQSFSKCPSSATVSRLAPVRAQLWSLIMITNPVEQSSGLGKLCGGSRSHWQEAERSEPLMTFLHTAPVIPSVLCHPSSNCEVQMQNSLAQFWSRGRVCVLNLAFAVPVMNTDRLSSGTENCWFLLSGPCFQRHCWHDYDCQGAPPSHSSLGPTQFPSYTTCYVHRFNHNIYWQLQPLAIPHIQVPTVHQASYWLL